MSPLPPWGPLPRDMKEYQQWATQPDPAPCHRDQLFAVPDAERVTRLHQLRRLSRDRFWMNRPTAERNRIVEEIEKIKNELDGTPWIPMKMTEINVVEPKQLFLKTGKALPQIQSPKALPTVNTIEPPEGTSSMRMVLFVCVTLFLSQSLYAFKAGVHIAPLMAQAAPKFYGLGSPRF